MRRRRSTPNAVLPARDHLRFLGTTGRSTLLVVHFIVWGRGGGELTL